MRAGEHLSREAREAVRLIRIRSRRRVHESLGGPYGSVFRGAGLEFAEVREYQAGDEVRTIDWNVSARMGRTYVKKFEEERRQTMFFLVDVSPSTATVATQGRRQTMAEVVGVLATAALEAGDRVGGLFFQAQVQAVLPETDRKSALDPLIQEVVAERAAAGTSLRTALERALTTVPRNAVVFLLSDFQDQDFEDVLAVAARKFDLVGVHVRDDLEPWLESRARVCFQDQETETFKELDLRSARVRGALREAQESHVREVRELLLRHGAQCVEILTHEAPYAPLVRFFRRREERLAR